MKFLLAFAATLTLGLGLCGGAMAFAPHAQVRAQAPAPVLHGDCMEFACGQRAA